MEWQREGQVLRVHVFVEMNSNWFKLNCNVIPRATGIPADDETALDGIHCIPPPSIVSELIALKHLPRNIIIIADLEYIVRFNYSS